MRRILLEHLLFALMVMLSAALMLDGLEEKSPTEDEWAHLVRGLQFWHGDDHRLQYAHPPLANAVLAAPMAFDDDVEDFSTLDGWDSATVGRVAFAYIRSDYGAARAKLMRARRASVGLALLGLLYAYLWGRAMLGRRGGLVLASLLAFHPTILGQARYVSTDLACAIACFIAVGELARHMRGGAPWATWFGVPLGLSGAILCKHSALLLVPGFVLITALFAALGRGSEPANSVSRRLARWAVHAAFVGAVILLALNLAYGGQQSGLTVAELFNLPEPQYWISAPYAGAMLEATSPLRWLPPGLRLPVPYPWLFGVSSVGVQSARGYPFGSFLGAANASGHSAFFPVICALKTPILHMLGWALAVAAACRRRRVEPGVALMGGVSLGFLVVASTSNLNMGVRHVLPVLYLGTVPAAAGLCRLGRLPCNRWAWGLLGAVMMLGPAVVHRADYLGYFNVGRSLGHRVCVVGEDVGQDRARFARWVEAQGIRPLYYDTQTKTRALEAQWVGLHYVELDCETRVLPGAFVALHASRRVTVGPGCYPQLVGREPLTTFNDHIDIYRIGTRPGEAQRARTSETRSFGRAVFRSVRPNFRMADVRAL